MLLQKVWQNESEVFRWPWPLRGPIFLGAHTRSSGICRSMRNAGTLIRDDHINSEEYQHRTLYTSWNLSYTRREGIADESPLWLRGMILGVRTPCVHDWTMVPPNTAMDPQRY